MQFSDLYVGQRVVVAFTSGNGFYDSREGKTGTIMELDKGASLDVMVSFDEPDVDDDWGQSRELAEVGGDAGCTRVDTANLSDLAVGDRVLVVGHGHGFFSFYEGKEGEIVQIDAHDRTLPVRVRFDSGDHDWGRPGGLELVEQDVRTPVEKLGYKVGDKFVVEHFSTFDKGSIITLHRDDGSSCPLFVGEGTRFRYGPGETPGAYVDLDSVRKYEPTPAEEAGFKVGDQAVVIDDECGFKAGQLVTLFSDDGSTCPTWKGENTRYNNAGGEPGAYASVSNMRKVDVAEQAKRVQELEAEVKRLNTLLQAARDLLN